MRATTHHHTLSEATAIRRRAPDSCEIGLSLRTLELAEIGPQQRAATKKE